MRYFFPLIILLASLLSCNDDEPIIQQVEPDIEPTASEVDITTLLVDIFASTTLETYYLWIDDPGRLELIDAVLNPDTCNNPVAALPKVLSEEDRWTELIENMTQYMESVSGTETSTGMQLMPYLLDKVSQRVFFVVLYVHPGSPADIAGIKRGDIIDKMDGQNFTASNYKNYYSNSKAMTLSFAEIQDNVYKETDRSVSLTPVKAYLEPVITTKVFDIDGKKKVGYLNYIQFNDSDSTLISAFDYFKSENVSELVLDLRYNGGGYLSTCAALASMMAPMTATENEDVFISSIYNQKLTEYYNKYSSLNDNFSKEYSDHNPDLKKIYCLISEYTASASEALIVGLSPYTEVTLIGEPTHGKFCSGIMMTPKNVFVETFYSIFKEDFKDWGMYVMVGTFADKNGYNGSRPNGFTPNIILQDNPFDGYDFGDPNETLLHKALELAGMKYPVDNTPTRTAKPSLPFDKIHVDRPAYSIKKVDHCLYIPLQAL